MKGKYGHPSAGRKRGGKFFKKFIQCPEFIIHRNTQCLETTLAGFLNFLFMIFFGTNARASAMIFCNCVVVSMAIPFELFFIMASAITAELGSSAFSANRFSSVFCEMFFKRAAADLPLAGFNRKSNGPSTPP